MSKWDFSELRRAALSDFIAPVLCRYFLSDAAPDKKNKKNVYSPRLKGSKSRKLKGITPRNNNIQDPDRPKIFSPKSAIVFYISTY